MGKNDFHEYLPTPMHESVRVIKYGILDEKLISSVNCVCGDGTVSPADASLMALTLSPLHLKASSHYCPVSRHVHWSAVFAARYNMS